MIPTNRSYTLPTGRNLSVGQTVPVTGGAPVWATSLVADTFVALPGATAFRSWANANIPAGAYQGSNPMGAMLDAYCDPAYDATGEDQLIYGGGHGDGTCNAVIAFNHRTLAYRLVGQPTPPTKYPPLYVPAVGSGRKNIYPSGASGEGGVYDAFSTPPLRSGGHFRDNLTNAADLAYNTARARASSHMYGAAAVRNGVVHYFYQTYAEFNIAAGTWANLGDYPSNFTLYTQLITFRPEYNSVELQQGTMVVYDEVTDRFLVTLIPGDNGGGWRSAIFVFNPVGRVIEQVIEFTDSDYGLLSPSVNLVKVGRQLYVFTKLSGIAYPNSRMHQGFILDMDTYAKKKFVLTGEQPGSEFNETTGNQESIPSFYDGVAIRRWNYSPTQRGFLYSVGLTPESGTGTTADPYVLRQTQRVINNAPTAPSYIYNRLIWYPAAGCAVLIPTSLLPPMAIKLS